MSDGWLNSRAAAKHVGYEPGVAADGTPLPTARDPQMKCFYAWVQRHQVVAHHRGRNLVFKVEELDAAIGRSTEVRQSRLDQMRDLAIRAARGERISGTGVM